MSKCHLGLLLVVLLPAVLGQTTTTTTLDAASCPAGSVLKWGDASTWSSGSILPSIVPGWECVCITPDGLVQTTGQCALLVNQSANVNLATYTMNGNTLQLENNAQFQALQFNWQAGAIDMQPLGVVRTDTCTIAPAAASASQICTGGTFQANQVVI